MRIKLLLFITLTTLFSEPIYSWYNTGHMTVAEIAYQNLDPDVRAKADQLIDILAVFYPDSNSFVKASTWMDDVRGHGVGMFNSWHYTLVPYDPHHLLTATDREKIAALNQGTDVIWAIKEAIKTLESPNSNAFERSFMLRILLHNVGDVHQPLHTTSRFSEERPNGDMGGNLFKIHSPIASHLHGLWDAMLGAGPVIDRDYPPTDADMESIRDYAMDLMARFPEPSLPEAADLDVKTWVQEGNVIASSLAFQTEPNKSPSADYILAGQAAAERRLVLAGYRLAHLLNQIMSKEHEPADAPSLPPSIPELAERLQVSELLLERYPDLVKFLVANHIDRQMARFGDQIKSGKYGIPIFIIDGQSISWPGLKAQLSIHSETGKLQGVVYTDRGFVRSK